jgi:hypothetical protein
MISEKKKIVTNSNIFHHCEHIILTLFIIKKFVRHFGEGKKPQLLLLLCGIIYFIL